MSDKPVDYGREVRDTVVKSSLTGVAATVLAVTIFSPAGFGGMIGTSLASGFGVDSDAAAAENPYASLPAFPAPLSQIELQTIQSQLAQTSASLEITRAATEERIEHIRSLALNGNAVTFTPPQARLNEDLRLTTMEPAAFEAAVAPAPAPLEAVTYRGTHLELAELLLANETY
jgi:hypothetical protein